MKICIVAAGLATRLQPLTNYIPKFLINIGKQTGFVEMIRYWKTYSDDFTIIIHPKYEELVKAYFDLYFGLDNIKLTIKTIDTALGTAHTIDTALGGAYDGDKILFTWCDVIPGAALSHPEIAFGDYDQVATVFTIDNQKNRYKFAHDTLVKVDDATGDVFGIYYVPCYENMVGCYTEGEDFADFLARQGNLINYEVDSIIDFGDKEKLYDVLKNCDEAREFNSIEIGEKLVHKKPLNPLGEVLIKREIDWYSELYHSNAFDVNVPKVYPSFDSKELVMERVNGVSIYKLFSSLDHDRQKIVLSSIFEQLNKLHANTTQVNPSIVRDDIDREAYAKLVHRYNEIKDVIKAFGKNIHIVNGLDVGNDPLDTIKRLSNALTNSYLGVETYSLIHGDLQMSNSMIDPDTLKITLIDPRGYFGKTDLYGLPAYDYAKVLYSLSGYDLFNYSNSFHIKNISNDEIEFDIPKPVFDPSAHRTMFSREHYLWLAVIWIGLAQYIKNNPIKSVAAHYHGLYLATKYLNGDFSTI